MERAYVKEFESILQRLQYTVDRSKLLSDVFALLACSISQTVDHRSFDLRQSEKDQILKTYRPAETKTLQELFSYLFRLCSRMSQPDGIFDDYLGVVFMNSNTQSKGAGQFFTPYDVSRMAAHLTTSGVEPDDHGVITIDEPACGSGGMLLATLDVLRKRGVNYAEEVFCHGADIDRRCVRMAYVQLSLAGAPAIIHCRDTLAMNTWETWFTPAYVFQWIKFRRYEGC